MNEEFLMEELDSTLVGSQMVVDEIDPELDKENWPVITIDPVKGHPNYEFVAAHGTLKNGQPFSKECQIMRGVEVAVPPSIVNVLKIAVSASYTQVPDPLTGKNMMVRSDQSSVPWRLVKPGKYFS
jgi:hypothetical protein